MGMIGRWIDEQCAAHPEDMQKVLEREWGNVRHWERGVSA